MPVSSLTPHRVPHNPDVQHIIITGAGREVRPPPPQQWSRYRQSGVPLQGVPANLCHDVVVGAVILTGEHADAVKPIVRHRIVLDADIEGVLVCPTKATHDVNAKEGVAGDGVAGDGRVAEDVVIAQREQKDPELLHSP